MWVLLRLRINDLPDRTAANLLSQYRFLRALELGFGLFAFTHWRRIYTLRSYNRLFLSVMTAGVAARLLSLALDGRTSWWMYLFLGWEPVGVVCLPRHARGPDQCLSSSMSRRSPHRLARGRGAR
jgi:hypothetical protein